MLQEQIKILSNNVIIVFRDKANNISLVPLSFEEFYKYKNDSSSDKVFEYKRYGGMPLSVIQNSDKKKEYLKGLFETTYFKDILDHQVLL